MSRTMPASELSLVMRPQLGTADQYCSAGYSSWRRRVPVTRIIARAPSRLARTAPGLRATPRRCHGGPEMLIRRQTWRPPGSAGSRVVSRSMRVDAVYGAIGRFSVRFRWLIVAVWIVGAILAGALLPALSSVTQNNNQKFLPASAASSKAADL